MKSTHLRTGLKRLLLAAAMAGAGWTANAQTANLPDSWVYINSGGVKTYSDVAPPVGTPNKDVLKRPGAVAAGIQARAPIPEASASRQQAASAPRVAGRDPTLEARLKAKAAQDSEKKEAQAASAKAQSEADQAKRKESCERQQQNATALQSDNRIARINAKGEREFLSDQQRAQELRQAQSNLAECAKD